MIMAAVLMGAGKLLDKLDPAASRALEHQQSLALDAVASFNPLIFYNRYVCALVPSVEQLNRESRKLDLGHGRSFTPHSEARTDCQYTLPDGTQPAANAPLPTPTVGHWSDGQSGFVVFIVALLDTAWHMIV
jgi:hypothetical protein